MMRIVIAAVLALTLGGCTAKDVSDALARASLYVKTSLQAGRDGIATYCNSLVKAEAEATAMAIAASTGQCKAVTRVQSVISVNASICNNVGQLTDNQVGNYSKTIAGAFKDAQAALKAGCQ